MRFGCRIGNLMVALAIASAVAGCANAPGYPTLPVGDVIGQKTLSPTEQEAEIKSLNDAQSQNSQAAGAAGQPEYIPASQTAP